MRDSKMCLACGKGEQGEWEMTDIMHANPADGKMDKQTDASPTTNAGQSSLDSCHSLSSCQSLSTFLPLHPSTPPHGRLLFVPSNQVLSAHSTRRQGAENSSTQPNSTCTVEHFTLPILAFLTFVCSHLFPDMDTFHISTHTYTHTHSLILTVDPTLTHPLSPVLFIPSSLPHFLLHSTQERFFFVCICSSPCPPPCSLPQPIRGPSTVHASVASDTDILLLFLVSFVSFLGNIEVAQLAKVVRTGLGWEGKREGVGHVCWMDNIASFHTQTRHREAEKVRERERYATMIIFFTYTRLVPSHFHANTRIMDTNRFSLFFCIGLTTTERLLAIQTRPPSIHPSIQVQP